MCAACFPKPKFELIRTLTGSKNSFMSTVDLKITILHRIGCIGDAM